MSKYRMWTDIIKRRDTWWLRQWLKFDLPPKIKNSIVPRLCAVLILFTFGWMAFPDKQGYSLNLFTELIGVATTFIVLDWWVKRRDNEKEKKEVLARLLRHLKSGNPDEVKQAINELRDRGILTDGSLRNQFMAVEHSGGGTPIGIDLSKQDLGGVDFQGSQFYMAKLQGAFLNYANFDRAYFLHCDMSEAWLQHASFRNATLAGLSLEEADLKYADFVGANLSGVSLEKAFLGGAYFDENTTLPDGSKWTPDTDMGRFTDRTHLDFYDLYERHGHG